MSDTNRFQQDGQQLPSDITSSDDDDESRFQFQLSTEYYGRNNGSVNGSVDWNENEINTGMLPTLPQEGNTASATPDVNPGPSSTNLRPTLSPSTVAYHRNMNDYLFGPRSVELQEILTDSDESSYGDLDYLQHTSPTPPRSTRRASTSSTGYRASGIVSENRTRLNDIMANFSRSPGETSTSSHPADHRDAQQLQKLYKDALASQARSSSVREDVIAFSNLDSSVNELETSWSRYYDLTIREADRFLGDSSISSLQPVNRSNSEEDESQYVRSLQNLLTSDEDEEEEMRCAPTLNQDLNPLRQYSLPNSAAIRLHHLARYQVTQPEMSKVVSSSNSNAVAKPSSSTSGHELNNGELATGPRTELLSYGVIKEAQQILSQFSSKMNTSSDSDILRRFWKETGTIVPSMAATAEILIELQNSTLGPAFPSCPNEHEEETHSGETNTDGENYSEADRDLICENCNSLNDCEYCLCNIRDSQDSKSSSDEDPSESLIDSDSTDDDGSDILVPERDEEDEEEQREEEEDTNMFEVWDNETSDILNTYHFDFNQSDFEQSDPTFSGLRHIATAATGTSPEDRHEQNVSTSTRASRRQHYTISSMEFPNFRDLSPESQAFYRQIGVALEGDTEPISVLFMPDAPKDCPDPLSDTPHSLLPTNNGGENGNTLNGQCLNEIDESIIENEMNIEMKTEDSDSSTESDTETLKENYLPGSTDVELEDYVAKSMEQKIMKMPDGNTPPAISFEEEEKLLLKIGDWKSVGQLLEEYVSVGGSNHFLLSALERLKQKMSPRITHNDQKNDFACHEVKGKYTEEATINKEIVTEKEEEGNTVNNNTEGSLCDILNETKLVASNEEQTSSADNGVAVDMLPDREGNEFSTPDEREYLENDLQDLEHEDFFEAESKTLEMSSNLQLKKKKGFKSGLNLIRKRMTSYLTTLKNNFPGGSNKSALPTISGDDHNAIDGCGDKSIV